MDIICFKPVHYAVNAKLKLWPLIVKMVVEWPFRENGDERIDTSSAEVGFCALKCDLKSLKINRSKWAVIEIEQTPYKVKKIRNNKLIK